MVKKARECRIKLWYIRMVWLAMIVSHYFPEESYKLTIGILSKPFTTSETISEIIIEAIIK